MSLPTTEGTLTPPFSSPSLHIDHTEQWRVKLNPEQFRVLRQKGTERAGTGEYNKHKEAGVYRCAGCDAALYK